MGNPALKNGVPITMSNGSSTVNRAFDGLLPNNTKRNPGGLSLVTLVSTLGGLTFTASLVSIHTKIQGQFVVLQGAVVTSPDGYSGTVGPAQCGGPGLNVN